jgi:hypothetical protein
VGVTVALPVALPAQAALIEDVDTEALVQVATCSVKVNVLTPVLSLPSSPVPSMQLPQA